MGAELLLEVIAWLICRHLSQFQLLGASGARHRGVQLAPKPKEA